jgi:peptide/nickel transport system substrate-binding protein
MRGQRRPALSDGRLSPDDPAGRRRRQPDAGIGTGPYKIVVNEPGVRTPSRRMRTTGTPTIGHADEVEILVINDSTARTAALQSGQVHMINRVDPKIVDLLKGVPGRVDQGVAGRGHYVFIALQQGALRQQRPAPGAEIRDQPRRRWSTRSWRLRLGRQRLPDQRGLSAVRRQHRAAPVDRPRRPSTTRSPATTAARSAAHAPVAFPGAVDAAKLYRGLRPRPASRSRSSWSPATATGRTSGTSSPSAPPTGAAVRCRTRCIPPPTVTGADWNDTKFKNAKFDELLLAARGELDAAKRKRMYSEMAHILRDEGGLILPMFNDFVSGVSGRRSAAGSTIRTAS